MKCKNCEFFEERSKFCRKNPPIPVVSYIEKNGNMHIETKSMFPVIPFPELDWCDSFQENKDK